MPRGPRHDYPGAVHHAYARGNEKREVFLDDRDRRDFLFRLGKNLSRWNVRSIAWALMSNHFHLLVQCPGGNLAAFMQCLLTGYSLYFNRRHQRVGHLFQNRYKSEALSRESHYRELVRYIHLNPIRAGTVSSLEELAGYLWTGHRRIVSGNGADWQDLESIRDMFHSPRRTWQQEYVDFLAAGIRTSPAPGRSEVDRFQIRPDLVEQGILPANAALPPARYFQILETVSAKTGISPAGMSGKGGSAQIVRARRLLLSICREELKIPTATIARWIGVPTYSAWYLLRSAPHNPGPRLDCNP